VTDENTIAIVAIVVSGVISLATLIASFYTNRANHRAELKKIAYERQIEALREVYETLSIYITSSNNLIRQWEELKNTDEFMPIFDTWSEKLYTMNAIYQKNAVFIPDNVDFAYHRRYNSDQKDAANQPLTEER
jgi:heme/copper-type cytochrome/quinol oxidase subunit 2